ncbi:zinc ribbon domain-containing protein [Paracoccaceae bacterium]|jgi:putative FmdB family regulatory protein|nr:zinc ribbon domain-containing protein [Paracoccaceae bacterium]|tara:strand:- start:247 stop:597 length:351 start_codon:yes stop_codon:yes gene_type:complete
MPVYEYNCKKCGTFTNLQSMLRAGEACACTKCGALSERALATPTLYSLSDEKRKAHSTNEKSANEPNRIKGGNKNKDNGHGSNCSCCGSGNKKSTTMHLPDGSKTFPTKRSWMISH